MSDPPADARPDASGWLRIGPSCAVRTDELRWVFGPSGGPGGQHANKAATRAEVRFDIAASASLSPDQRDRLVGKLGPTVTVAVDETRSQHRNRAIALDRLRARLAGALARPRPRRPTRPTRGAVERRLDAKRRRAGTKSQRRRPTRPDD